MYLIALLLHAHKVHLVVVVVFYQLLFLLSDQVCSVNSLALWWLVGVKKKGT